MVNEPPEAQETLDTDTALAHFPRFFDLPLELRAMIYEYALESPIVITLPHVILPPLFRVSSQICQEIYATVVLEARIFIWHPSGTPDRSSQSQAMAERYYVADRRRLRLHIYALDAVVTFERAREILRLLRTIWKHQMPGPRVYVMPQMLGRNMRAEWRALRRVKTMVGYAEEARWNGNSFTSVLAKIVALLKGMEDRQSFATVS